MKTLAFIATILLLGAAFPDSIIAVDKIRIGYSGATVSNAMLWVTDEGKLFQKTASIRKSFICKRRLDR